MAKLAMLRCSDSLPFFDIVKLGSGRAGLCDRGARRLQQCHRPARLSPARARLVPQGRTEDEIDQIDLKAPDLIPNCLATILHQSRSELSRPVPANLAGQPFKTGQKPGRNDACSCGSGRKYKQCCGRN